VPNDFHSTSDNSSIFGSPKSEIIEDSTTSADRSPTATLRAQPTDKSSDKSRWKTLRGFIDERAIEEVLETVELERAVLDVGSIHALSGHHNPPICTQDVIATTAEYPQTLTMMNAAVKSSLPQPSPLLPIEKILSSQTDVSIDMARHLDSLTAHYDQMAIALKDCEAGEMFSEEDLQGMCVDKAPCPLPP
jgi:autophagy-related protein 17